MIAQLRGTLIHIYVQSIVIDVGGVGYLVHTIPGHLDKIGIEVTLHTHLAVRETAMDLYGFLTQDELEMFALLLTLPKIGPKSAMQIMSQADIALIKKAVANEDATYLTKMSGIGKKTAEKIVMELKDKFEYGGAVEMAGAEGAGHATDMADTSDVIDALITLGYPQKEAREVVQKIDPEITETKARITAALKLLSK